MTWEKLGLIYSPSGQYPWMRTHAALPVVLPLDARRYRVYFATRDAENRSHVGYIELEPDAGGRDVVVADRPALAPGPLGCFDDHGVYASTVVEQDGVLLLYYIGWNPGPRWPLFYPSIGLAVSEDGGKAFRRYSPAPILARSRHDPCFASAPFVLVENGIWRMWYISGLRWEPAGETLQSFYHIKYAESRDGIEWRRDGQVCLDLRPGETNISRLCVVKTGTGYQGWFSYSHGHGNKGYRIGYAESDDGCVWRRLDAQAGIEPSEVGWDSALAYPYVTVHDGRSYLFYNGRDYGRDGIGLAVRAAVGRGAPCGSCASS